MAELLEEAHCHDPLQSINTVESPIEKVLPFAKQMQVTPGSGQSYASFISHILRMDPDIIMVGELGNKETIQAAIQAALTGHLVIGAIHAQKAKTAIDKLMEAIYRKQQKAQSVIFKNHLVQPF